MSHVCPKCGGPGGVLLLNEVAPCDKCHVTAEDLCTAPVMVRIFSHPNLLDMAAQRYMAWVISYTLKDAIYNHRNVYLVPSELRDMAYISGLSGNLIIDDKWIVLYRAKIRKLK